VLAQVIMVADSCGLETPHLNIAPWSRPFVSSLRRVDSGMVFVLDSYVALAGCSPDDSNG
jgi:hypothetical protein